MTSKEWQTITKVLEKCLLRILDEAKSKRPNYEIAAGDVQHHLSFLLDWMNRIETTDQHSTADMVKK